MASPGGGSNTLKPPSTTKSKAKKSISHTRLPTVASKNAHISVNVPSDPFPEEESEQDINQMKKKRQSEFYYTSPLTTFASFFSNVRDWFRGLLEAAAKQRKLYRKEECYTVADFDPEDEELIETTNLPIIWVLSSPGSPVTALIYAIAESYHWYYVNLGALLQREISLETKRDDAVAHLMHRGIALPRAFVFEVIRRQMANISRKGEHQGFIFSEYPTTFSQCKDFTDFIRQPDFILYLRFSERTAQENLCIYMRFQVRASKILRKLQPDVYVVASEQFKKFKHEIYLIQKKYGEKFKIVDTTQSVEEVCKDIMKWVERAAVLHNIIPPLFVKGPLPHLD